MRNKGILEDKLKRYYSDANLDSYRDIFFEGVKKYKGKNLKYILDIGSGVGSFAEAVKDLNKNVYCLEASDYGFKKCLERGFNCKKFLLKKGERLPFEDNKFSLVVMNQVIEHIDKKTGQYYIKEIFRVLEPGGVCIIKSPSRYSTIWRTDPNHVYCWKPKELFNEVNQYIKNKKDIELHRVVLEPWMFVKYNEDVINTWHKYNEHPVIKQMFRIPIKVLDKILHGLTGTDILLAVSNITFVKS